MVDGVMLEITIEADIREIQATLAVLHESGTLIELCAIGNRGIASGYYDDHDALARKASKLNDSGKYSGIYITANPLKRIVLKQRKANTLYLDVKKRTRDDDFEQRRWLILDIDPVRAPKTSATVREKSAASWCESQTVGELRREFGLPEPIHADSGNGFYALYRVDEPNDKKTKDLFRRVTQGVAVQYSIRSMVEGEPTEVVSIDPVTFNAARLLKLFGTRACKGSDTDERPHRYSRLLGIPKNIETVTRAQLENLADTFTEPKRHSNSTGSGITPVTVEEFLKRGGVEVKRVVDEADDGKKWILDACPFNPEHTNSPAVFLSGDGVPGFNCFHENTCGDNHWQEFRAEIEERMGARFQFVDGPYYETEAGLFMHRITSGSEQVEKQLTNFCARIIADIEEDNGIEMTRTLKVDATCRGRKNQFQIAASQFQAMNWSMEKIGAEATIMAGLGTRDHARAGIQLLSGEVAHEKVYTHTGWRKIQGEWVYLHSDGAIGANGQTDAISVKLPPNLALFRLPEAPSGERLKAAVRKSLQFLELAPYSLTVPVYSAIWRSVLGPADFSEHATGPTGTFKSSVFALAMQHFGSGFDGRHLPGSWSSTANANAALQFIVKDALIVIDDFVPRGSGADIERQHREADRLFRGQGNNSGRGRMTRDGSLRDPNSPRGLTLSTGEDVPRGESLQSRVWVLEFSPGDVDLKKLTACQADAAAGAYAETMAAFLQWLAPKYSSITRKLPKRVEKCRAAATRNGQHSRTPEITANLMIGIDYFLRFATESGALSKLESKRILRKAWKALQEAAAAQTRGQAAEEPARRFLDLVASAIMRGDARLGDASSEGEDNDQVHGRLVGWRTEDDSRLLLLEPDSAYAVANQLAEQQGDSLRVTKKTLWKRLRERGFLARQEKQRNMVHFNIRGGRRLVVCVKKEAVFPSDHD
jgi:hypothetical protein